MTSFSKWDISVVYPRLIKQIMHNDLATYATTRLPRSRDPIILTHLQYVLLLDKFKVLQLRR